MVPVDVLLVRLKGYLNKLDSQDYDNIETWQLLDFYNTSARMWCRQQLHGGNMYREGDEQSKRRIDDLSVLLKEDKTPSYIINKYDSRYDVINLILPSDYMYYKYTIVELDDECSTAMSVFLVEQGNLNMYLDNTMFSPSRDWGQTIGVMLSNTFRIFIPAGVGVKGVHFYYYRYPKLVEKAGEYCLQKMAVSTMNVDPEFNDDVVDIIAHNTVSLIGSYIQDGDINAINKQITSEYN